MGRSELNVSTMHFHFPSLLFEAFKMRLAGSQLALQIFTLQREGLNLVLDLPDLLFSILKNEELFQVGVHGPEGIGSALRRQ